jgi:hypothetical protein
MMAFIPLAQTLLIVVASLDSGMLRSSAPAITLDLF